MRRYFSEEDPTFNVGSVSTREHAKGLTEFVLLQLMRSGSAGPICETMMHGVYQGEMA